MVLGMLGCQSVKEDTEQKFQYQGQTMGTTYAITTVGLELKKVQIDSILNEVNQSVSTYIPTSLISKVNATSDSIIELSQSDPLTSIFVENYRLSASLYEQSEGAFDVGVMPLVNLWGFGYKGKSTESFPDSSVVDSVLKISGFRQWQLLENGKDYTLTKAHPSAELDFSAVAKGYGVDVIGRWVESKGGVNYLVEIGGEVRGRGHNQKGNAWRIGINVPDPKASTDDITVLTELKDKAMATSGNYRNFYELDGQMVSHSINPSTGYPERNQLLSATIVADECAVADAMATTCMVLGLEGAKALVEASQNVEAYFIFGASAGDYQVWSSSAFPEVEKIQ